MNGLSKPCEIGELQAPVGQMKHSVHLEGAYVRRAALRATHVARSEHLLLPEAHSTDVDARDIPAIEGHCKPEQRR